MSVTCIIAFDYEDPDLSPAVKAAATELLGGYLQSHLGEDLSGPQWAADPNLGRISTGDLAHCVAIRDAIVASELPFTITACGDPTALMAGL